MKTGDGILLFVMLVCIFAVLFIFITTTNQVETFSTNDSCEQLRECILLELNCLDRYIENKFLVWTWEFNDKGFPRDQNDYYKENCYDIRDSDGGRR